MFDLFKNISKTIVSAAKYIFPSPITHVTSAVVDLVSQNKEIARDYHELQAAQLKLEYFKHQDNGKLQTQLAQFNHEKAKEIQTYIQNAENLRLDKKLDFDKWIWEQKKALQLQLLELNQRLQTQILLYQRETSLKILEEQKKLDNSPIWLVTSDIITNNNQQKITPLRVFFAPPKLQFERLENPANNNQDLPNLELTIAEGLRHFILNYTNGDRKIDFLAGAWISKSFHSEASIKSLFSVLKTEPTIILESEIDGKLLNFRIAYWFKNSTNYNYRPIISRLPYQEILFNSAKERALKWQETRQKLIELGENPEEIDQLYGGDNVQNLTNLIKEEKFKQAGINDLKITYLVNEEDWHKLGEFLVIYHNIFSGLIADEYFLTTYQLTPQLPTLIPDLIKEIKQEELLTEIIESVKVYYEQLYDSLTESYGVLLPELLLDFALVLSKIDQQNWANLQVIKSLKFWLKQRGLLTEKLANEQHIKGIFSIVETNLTITDEQYINKLNQCLITLNFEDNMTVNFQVIETELTREIIDNELNITPEIVTNNEIVIKDVEKEKVINYLDKLNLFKQYQINPQPNQWVLMSLAISADITCFATLFLKNNLNLSCLIYNFNSGISSQDIEIIKLSNYPNYSINFATYQQNLKSAIINNDFSDILMISWGQKIPYFFNKQLYQKKWGKYEILEKFDLENCSNVNISNNNYLSIGDYKGGIKIYQISPNNYPKLPLKFQIQAHFNIINSLVFSPDEQILASGGDTTIKLWNVKIGRLIHTLTNNYTGSKAIIFSPDSQTIFGVIDDNMIKQWNVKTGEEIVSFQGHKCQIYSLAIHPEGKLLVSSSDDNMLKFWYIPTGEEIKSIPEFVRKMKFSLDGKTFATLNNSNAKLWQSV